MNTCAGCLSIQPTWSGLSRYCSARMMFVIPDAPTDCDLWRDAAPLVLELYGQEPALADVLVCGDCVVRNARPSDAVGFCTYKAEYRTRYTAACRAWFATDQLKAPLYGAKKP